MHSLRFRFLLCLSLVAGLSLLSLWGIAHFLIYPNLLEREDAYVEKEIGRALTTLQIDLDDLGGDTRDWASWDYTYGFMQGERPDYPRENFSQEMFEDMDQLMMVFMHMDGTPAWVTGYDRHVNHYTSCATPTGQCQWIAPIFNVLQKHVLTQPPTLETWLLSTPVPAMVATSPIVPTDRGNAPPIGWLAIVRSMDAAWFESVREQSGVGVSIEPVLHPELRFKPPPVIRVSDGQLMAIRWLDATPAGSRLALQATLPRRDFMANVQSFNFAMIWTAGVLLTVLIVILGLLEVIVLAPTRRLARFTRKQRHDNCVSDNLPVSLVARHDEIGSLAREFQRLLTKQKARTESLEQLSQHDHLTGLFNRRHLDGYLAQTLMNAHQSHQPVGLIIIDIDYFKPYNDHYGHIEGDHCLINVARAMQRVITVPGMLARSGGEEFIAVLPEANAENTWHIAEQLRAAVARLEIPHAYSRAAEHISISAGLAIYQPDHPCQPVELIRLADESLYRAKKAGRNRVDAQTQRSGTEVPTEADLDMP